MEEETEIVSGGGLLNLFYVLDLGDALAVPLERVFQPLGANLVGHLCSFGINAGLWIGVLAVAKAILF